MATNKTSVIGYFNPNDYPLLISVSEHNMQIQLEPKKYIVDRTGALVNDPLLNAYVGRGRLSRASDPKQQVDVVLLRPVNPAPTPGVPATTFTHAVSQATGFQTKNGRVEAIMPPTTATGVAVPPPASYNPVKSYTMEEAKRLRLVRPTRPVPENYGAEETTGAPRSGREIPEIKYAVDSQRAAKSAPLPAELAKPATPQQAAIIENLQRASSVDHDDPNLLRHVAGQVANAAVPPPPRIGPIPGLPKPQLTEETPAQEAKPVRVSAPPIPKNPQPTQIVNVQEEAPVEDAEPSLVVEEDLGNADAATVAVPPPPADEEDGLTCPRCPDHAPFKNIGLFKRHVRKFHPESEAVLMQPFATSMPS